MKFGKTDLKPEEIDFSIPEFQKLKIPFSNKPLNILVGQPVWSAKGNIGKIYPKGTAASDFLYHYSRAFSSIELNATFYKIPGIDQVKRWKEQSPEDFKFCPKIPQFISQRKNLSEKSETLNEFLTNIFHFEDRLGITFLQLPPHFRPENADDLKKFIKLLPSDLLFAIEFRNEEWFKANSTFISMLDFMRKRNISAVVTDTPGRRDVLHLNVNSENVIIRFKGNNLHESDFTRTSNWVKRSLEMIQAGVKTIYFFVHQEDESLGIELAQQFVIGINKSLGSQFRYPAFITNQASLF